MLLVAAIGGCSSSDNNNNATAGSGGSTGGSGGSAKAGSGGSGGAGGSGATCSNPGGAVSGAADMHCIMSGMQTKQVTNESACHPADAAVPPSSSDDAGSDFGATLYGMEGDDDDCKYHISWTSTPICEGSGGVTFTAMVTKLADGSPLSVDTSKGQALVDLEVYLNDTHTTPSTSPKMKQTAPGTFTIGPIVFDKPGKWTVRFHIREDCADLTDDSPHGHAAFYVNVP